MLDDELIQQATSAAKDILMDGANGGEIWELVDLRLEAAVTAALISAGSITKADLNKLLQAAHDTYMKNWNAWSDYVTTKERDAESNRLWSRMNGALDVYQAIRKAAGITDIPAIDTPATSR